MGDFSYDVAVGGLTPVAAAVRGHAAAADQQGGAAAEAAQAAAGLCGTASGVAAVLSRVIAPRSGTGTKAAAYGRGCADVLDQVAMIVTEGDREMADTAQTAAAGVSPTDAPGGRA